MKVYLLALIFVLAVSCTKKTSTRSDLPLQQVKVCSFNIQFLGNSKLRDNYALADVLRKNNCDAVAVQELLAPPDLRLLKSSSYFGKDELPIFPNTGNPHKPSDMATGFFIEMEKAGYDKFLLSEQDTGPGENNQTNGSATEWYVTFFKSNKFEVASDLPMGFLAEDVTAHPDWDRVPYAFPLRTVDRKMDFVLISVHLRPGAGLKNQNRRRWELDSIEQWIKKQYEASTERHYIVLGDMNIESAKELLEIEPKTLVSLNVNAQFLTNTNVISPKPYDHVMVSREFSNEIPKQNNFEVIDLIKEMLAYWKLGPETYPGHHYNHNIFRAYYTDHHPVGFIINIPDQDDD